jgi:hypothetical protein
MAAWCKDPWLKQIRHCAYIPVLQPKTGTQSLRVLSHQGNDLNGIGLVADLFAAGAILVPVAEPDEEVTAGNRVRSGRLKVGLNVHLLHAELELLGVKGASPRLRGSSCGSGFSLSCFGPYKESKEWGIISPRGEMSTEEGAYGLVFESER